MIYNRDLNDFCCNHSFKNWTRRWLNQNQIGWTDGLTGEPDESAGSLWTRRFNFFIYFLFYFIFLQHQKDVVFIISNLSLLPKGWWPDEGANRSTMVKRKQGVKNGYTKAKWPFCPFSFFPNSQNLVALPDFDQIPPIDDKISNL